jgi:hypothetical protein
VAALRGDGLPDSINHNIIARCSKGWPLVPADHPAFGEDLCYGPVLPGRGTPLIRYLGVVVIPKYTSRARSLLTRTETLTPYDSLSSMPRYNFLLSEQGRVLLIIVTFIIITLLLLELLSRGVLSLWALRHHNLDLKRLLLLRYELR